MDEEQILLNSASPQAAVLVCLFYGLMLLAGTAAAIILIIRAIRHPVDWNTRDQWLRSRPWTWREGLMVAAIVGFLIAATMALITLLGRPRDAILIVTQGLLLDLAGIIAIGALLRNRGWSWLDAFGMGGPPGRFLKSGLLFYLALLPVLLFSSIVYQGILTARGYPPSLQDIALLLSGDHPLWMRCFMVFLAVAVAPFFEECLFRGILLPIMIRRMGVGAGIFFVSLFFASIHAHLPSLIPLMVVAAGFSLAYLYSRSLWVPIVMHGVFNGVNLAMLLILRP